MVEHSLKVLPSEKKATTTTYNIAQETISNMNALISGSPIAEEEYGDRWHVQPVMKNNNNNNNKKQSVTWGRMYVRLSSHVISHLSLNREGRWGTTDNFATSFLHFSLFSTAL